MPIKSLSTHRRLQRLGSIRLGIKKKTATGKEYPAEVDYFLLDPNTGNEKWNEDLKGQFCAKYGEKPTAITIMFPPVDPELFFPQWRKRYGAGGILRCKGDGDTALNPGEAVAIDEKAAEGLTVLGQDQRGMVRVRCDGEDCPYSERNECAVRATLQVMLPEINGLGVWQIATGSWNSIVNLNSAIEWLRGICGRYDMIPIKLMRVPTDITYEGKKAKHFILQVDQNTFSLADLQRAALTDRTRIMLLDADSDEEPELPDLRPKRVFQLPGPAPAPVDPLPVEATAPHTAETPRASTASPEPSPTGAIQCPVCRKVNVPVNRQPLTDCERCGNRLPAPERPAAAPGLRQGSATTENEPMVTKPAEAQKQPIPAKNEAVCAGVEKPITARQLDALSMMATQYRWTESDIAWKLQNQLLPGTLKARFAELTVEEAYQVIAQMNKVTRKK